MKKQLHVLGLLAALVGLARCSSDNNVRVEGELINFTKGKIYVYQHDYDADSLVVVDSIPVHGNNSFVFETHITEPSVFWMSTSNKDKSLAPLFFTPGDTYKMVLDGNFAYNPTLIGSQLHDQYLEYAALAKAVNLKSYEMLNDKIADASKADDINEFMNRRQKNFLLFKANKAVHQFDSTIIAPYIALYELQAYPKLMDTIYKSLDADIKKTKMGRMLKRSIKSEINDN